MAGESGVIFVDEKIDSAADLLVSLPKARSAGAALVATENPSVAINTERCRLVVERTVPNDRHRDSHGVFASKSSS